MSSQSGAPRAQDEVASLEHAWKFYGGTPAVKDVSLALCRGEVHMLLGENGAGKSTVVGMLIGTHALDRGTLRVGGTIPVRYSPTEARRAGINAVLQDFSLAPDLTVAENYFLGRERTRSGLLRKSQMRAAAAEAVEQLGIALDVDAQVSRLSRAEQQSLEIVRALGGRPGALILDEPTATLSHEESERLFAIVQQLKQDGWAILYITHRLEEMHRLGDRVTILRNGEMIGVHEVAAVTDEQLINEMVGRPLTTLYPRIDTNPGTAALVLRGVSSQDGRARNISLSVARGEIVGIGGLVGCGKAEVGRIAFGLLPTASGTIELDGRDIGRHSPKMLLRSGLVYLPQDRAGEALSLDRTVAENVTLEAVRDPAYSLLGMVRRGPLRRLVQEIVRRLDIRPPRSQIRTGSLSGGNQQKVVLGRALTRERIAYIFDEPTAGIDVGARLDFYGQLKVLCESGAAILLITSDLQELIHLSHRIYVMHGGEIVAELSGERRTEQMVVRFAFGERAAA